MKKRRAISTAAVLLLAGCGGANYTVAVAPGAAVSVSGSDSEREVARQLSLIRAHGQALRPIKIVLPRHPGVDGEVQVTFLITRLGDVTQVKAERATSPEHERLVAEALSQWRFEPIIVDGEAKVTRARITIPFRRPS